jgi:hypothetical protein
MRERTVSVASNLLYAVLGIMGMILLEAAKGQECQQINGVQVCPQECPQVNDIKSCPVPCPAKGRCRRQRANPPPSYNGCGPESVAKLINAGVIPQGFDQADFANGGCSLPQLCGCNRHDICYGTCNADKAACDRQFEEDLEAECRREFAIIPGEKCGSDACMTSQDKRGICLSRAHAYVNLVTGAGQSAFDDAQKQACECFPSYKYVGSLAVTQSWTVMETGCTPNPWISTLEGAWDLEWESSGDLTIAGSYWVKATRSGYKGHYIVPSETCEGVKSPGIDRSVSPQGTFPFCGMVDSDGAKLSTSSVVSNIMEFVCPPTVASYTITGNPASGNEKIQGFQKWKCPDVVNGDSTATGPAESTRTTLDRMPEDQSQAPQPLVPQPR